MAETASNAYERVVLDHPLVALALSVLAVAGFAWHAQDFQLDVSQESLVLEGDEALRYYESIQGRYGSDDVVIVTYTPEGDLFAAPTLARLAALQGELLAMERVESVLSILDVPLLRSPPVSLTDVQGGLRTLSDPDTDVALAARELRESILYKDLLVGSDQNTTALQISFVRDARYTSLREARNRLRSKQLDGDLTAEETQELARLTEAFRAHTRSLGALLDEDIAHIRSVIRRYEDHAELHLAGGPMIVSDMIAYVRHDLRVFGLAVVGIVALLLAAIFRQPRWVALPLAIAVAAGVMTIGFVSAAGWLVTVVSSNFVPLVLIFTLSLSVHLIVHYRELQSKHPDAAQRFLVRRTLRAKAVPCLYTVLTTIVAFGSLVVSGIRPVIDFGWIMVVGLVIGFLLNFVLFPACLMLLPPRPPPSEPRLTGLVTGFCARVIDDHGSAVLAVTGIVMVVCGWGVTTLSVENSFINYFKESTEIYQGMWLADQKLGGTTPLDVVVDAPAEWLEEPEPEEWEEEDEDWLLDYDIGGDPGFTGTSYWFNTYRFEQIEALHAYVDSIEATGKVISLATTLRVLEQLNEGEPFDDFDLAVLYKKIPADLKASMISPYLSEDGNQIRLAVRVEDSDPKLARARMLADIRTHLVEELGYEDEQVHLSGMMVLYNNMLQSLFRSQILTLGAVMAVVAATFALLFRSVRVAAVAIVPNVIAATLVLGIMGLLGVPLDIMTITIAAIVVGIAVDDTIHYLHRFRLELEQDGDYVAAVARSHASIGSAMYYTSSCVTIGFSIFVLSDFIPTIYFGILTALAMVAALAADLIVLPLLLERFKPFERRAASRP